MNETSGIDPKDRIQQVLDYFGNFDGVLVAYSGGVDSSTLAALAYRALADRAVAITADSQTLPRRELESAKFTARSIGIRHIIVPYDELKEPGFARNPVDRCYHCKAGLFCKLTRVARDLGLEVVADGTNASELEGHRPGHLAAQEHGVITPFAYLGITKSEIREMARSMELDIWNKPQQACLSSRFPYGKTITVNGLRRVERAEDHLFGIGISQCRVREHDNIARIEVIPEEFMLIIENRDSIISTFTELGYTYITLDVMGFRSGSMDEWKMDIRSGPVNTLRYDQ